MEFAFQEFQKSFRKSLIRHTVTRVFVLAGEPSSETPQPEFVLFTLPLCLLGSHPFFLPVQKESL